MFLGPGSGVSRCRYPGGFKEQQGGCILEIRVEVPRVTIMLLSQWLTVRALPFSMSQMGGHEGLRTGVLYFGSWFSIDTDC